MAITGPIPLPGTGIDAFLDELQRGQENKLKAAEAAKSQMLANLIQQAMGGGAEGAQGAGSSGGGTNNALLTSGLLGLPTHVVEGNIITPFGTQKIGESPQEKREAELGQTLAAEQGKTNIAESKTLKDTANTIRNSYGLYKELQDLLKENPNLTGFWPGVAVATRRSSNPKLAAFQEKVTKLQAALGRLASQRGGAAVTNWAAGGKPHPGNAGKYNLGMIESGLQDLKREYANVNKEHKSLTGKELDRLEEESNQEEPETLPPSMEMENVQLPQSEEAEQPVVGKSQAPSIARGMKLPKFNSQKEFQEWFKRQPLVVQHAVRLHLRPRGKR